MKKRILIGVGLIFLGLVLLFTNSAQKIVGGFSTLNSFSTLAAGNTLTADVTIASASYATLQTTAIELLPNPGAGQVNQIITVAINRVFASESWDNKSAQQPTIGYSAVPAFAITASLSTAVFSGGLANTVASPSYLLVNPAIAYNAVSNSAVVLRRSGSATPTIDGDTYFRVHITYKVITLP